MKFLYINEFKISLCHESNDLTFNHVTHLKKMKLNIILYLKSINALNLTF